MKNFARLYWKTLLFFTVTGLIGGFFTGIYLLDSYPDEIKQQLLESLSASGLEQMPVNILLGLVTAAQSAGYGLVLGAVGIFLGKKTGLWKDKRCLAKKPLAIAGAISVIGGLAMILCDLLFFGRYSEAIANSYAVTPTIVYMLATVTYGAVIEEVMLRLFTMSLIALILHKLSGKKTKTPATIILVTSNLITAALFAAGHLPATFMMIGNSPMIIVRCFAMNGCIALLFGYLYRKYGLRYAMIAHGGCHIVSKLIWILFV